MKHSNIFALSVLMLIFIVSGISYAATHTSGDYTIDLNLISNTEQCLSHCEQVYDIRVNKDYTMTDVNKLKAKFINSIGTDISVTTSYDIQLEKNRVDYINDYETKCNSYQAANGSTVNNCTSVLTGSHPQTTLYYDEFNPLGKTLKANKWYRIKIIIDRTPKLGKNSVDVIPSIANNDFTEYAWWNSSWTYCRNIDLTETIGTARSREPISVNFTNLNFTTGKDIRIVNAACNDGGQEVGHQLITNTSTSAYILFFANASASGTTTYSIYYGNTLAPDTSEALVIYYDDFNRANSATVGALMSSQGSWNETESGASTVAISNNKMKATGQNSGTPTISRKLTETTDDFFLLYTITNIESSASGWYKSIGTGGTDLADTWFQTDKTSDIYLGGWLDNQLGSWTPNASMTVKMFVQPTADKVSVWVNGTNKVANNAPSGSVAGGFNYAEFRQGDTVFGNTTYDDIYYTKFNITVYNIPLSFSLGAEQTLGVNDTTPPILNVTVPLEGRTYNTSSIIANLTTNEPVILCMYNTKNTLPYSSMLNDSATHWYVTVYNTPETGLAFNCTDFSGNYNDTVIINYTINTNKPTISIATPTNSTFTTDNITITFNTNGFDRAWYRLNGASEVWINNLSTFMASQGSNTLDVYLNNSAGNVNWTEVKFTVDTIAPVITINSPLWQNYYSIPIAFNVSTDENTDWCGTSISGASNITMTKLYSTAFYYSFIPIHTGEYIVKFSCNDTLGNMNNTALAVNFNTSMSAGINITVFDEDTLESIDNYNITVYGQSTTKTFVSYENSTLLQSINLTQETLRIRVSNAAYNFREYYISFIENDSVYIMAYIPLIESSHLVTFSIQDTSGNFLSGVNVNISKIIGSNWTQVGEAQSDDSGSANLYLNPSTNYKMVFTKSGYYPLTQYITPSLSGYGIIMASATGININTSFDYIFSDIYYSLLPSVIYDNTSTITFTIASTNGTLSGYYINVTINSTAEIGYASGSNPSGESMAVTVNLTNLTGSYLNIELMINKTGLDLTHINFQFYILPHEFINDTGTVYGLQDQIDSIPIPIRLIVALFIAVMIIYSFSRQNEGFGMEGSALSTIVVWGVMTAMGWFGNLATCSSSAICSRWIPFYTLLILTVIAIYWLRSRM